MHRSTKYLRILLIEANDMSKWVGGKVPFEMHIPPLALMYLASSVRRSFPDLEIIILEQSLDAPGKEHLTRKIESLRPDIIGIRSIVFFKDELTNILSVCRECTDAAVVIGGPIVGAIGRRLLEENAEIDIAVRGEGESALVRIIAGDEPETIPGVLFRDGKNIVDNGQAYEITAIDEIPFPSYDLIDIDKYAKQLSYTYNLRKQGILLTGRGCPYNCSFCFKHWNSVRLRSPKNVVNEIMLLHQRYGISDFYIIDDIFNVDRKRAIQIFDRIIAEGLLIRLYFANGLRTELVDEAFIDRAIQAGAIWFTYAIETTNDEIQKLIRKRIDLDWAHHVISYTQRQGVAVNISTMFGFPTESPDKAEETIEWLLSLTKPSILPYHFCLRIFPSCDIARQAVQAGWDLDQSLINSQYSYNDLPCGTPSFPKSKMIDHLVKYHREVGLNNPEAIRVSINTLKSIGYTDLEILAMYSVLKRKDIQSLDEV